MTILKTKHFPLLALMLVIGAFLMLGTTRAYASDSSSADSLTVDKVWMVGDILNIAVTDKDKGESKTLELNLGEYAKPGDEYVTIQATYNDGRASNSIQFKNPYYVPQAEDKSKDGVIAANTAPEEDASIESGKNPFTPDGTGTVLDNATDGDGKEFFTVETEDGSVFYLVVDRQRNADNVYLLGAVTNKDLVPLAEKGDDVSAIDNPATPESTVTPEPEPEPEPPAKTNNTGAIIFAVLS